MSGAQAVNGDGTVVPPPTDDGEIEQVARANGWRPQEDFKGPPEKWVPAETFVARGFESPAVLRERNQVLTERFNQMERTNRDLSAKVDTAVEALHSMTAMTRTAETRAYERARRELKEQAAAAVANADTTTYQRTQAELDELERTKPAPPPPPPPAPTAAPTRTTPGAPPPEAVAFFSRNPWYQADRELQEEADIIHTGLMAKRPGLTLEQNLAEVERRMREDPRFTDRIGGRRATPPANGNGNGRQTQQDDDDDDDRRGASTVTPSSGSPRPRRGGRRTFETMPQEAKVAYKKYADLLEGKGAPFTKEEYATNYWEQFPDDGS